MKRIMTIALMLIFAHGAAIAEYWTGDTDHLVACCEDRPGCQVLQTVMMGSFAQMDTEDSLNVRVLSAALPRLTAVTESDFDHFTSHFEVDPEEIREYYNIALANCLRADIIIMPLADDMDAQNARTVLDLFLTPSDETEVAEQRAAIRANTMPETLSTIAESAQVPVRFVEYLIMGEGAQPDDPDRP